MNAETQANIPMRANITTITAIDFEGTGKVRNYPDEPWQIGMISLINARVEPTTLFESLLRVGERPFNRYAPGRHAALRAQMQTAPTLQQLWPRLRARLSGQILAAHNCATENRYLGQAFPLHPPENWIDTLKLSRIAFPKIKSYKLEDLLERLDLTNRVLQIVPGREPHDALYDAVGCALLLEYILNLPGWKNVTPDTLRQIKS